MEFKKREWIGNWVYFERYIYSENAAMQQFWNEAEENAKTMPMFKNGVKSFWKMACNTITENNPVRLGGWKIADAGDAIEIEWLDEKEASLGKYSYVCREIVAKGLEAKENFLFEAKDAPADWAFRYLLAMEPMPERAAKESGGLLSHLHFQYAGTQEELLKDGSLCKPMWYATMCDADGDLLAECNIVRALHRMPKWEKLPTEQ